MLTVSSAWAGSPSPLPLPVRTTLAGGEGKNNLAVVRENLFSMFHIRIVDRPSSLPHFLYHQPRFSHSPSLAMSPGPTSLSSLGPATRAVHVGNRPDETTGAVLQPLTLSTTFKQNTPNVPFNCQSPLHALEPR